KFWHNSETGESRWEDPVNSESAQQSAPSIPTASYPGRQQQDSHGSHTTQPRTPGNAGYSQYSTGVGVDQQSNYYQEVKSTSCD
ncbi:unnamed protein product, partial [Heterosigma akashiwo]